MDQLAVKRRITSRQWNRIRFAFARTVEYLRNVVEKSEPLHRYRAALDILLEALAPLNKKERKLVQDALAAAAADTFPWYGGNNFQNQADSLILQLGISL